LNISAGLGADLFYFTAMLPGTLISATFRRISLRPEERFVPWSTFLAKPDMPLISRVDQQTEDSEACRREATQSSSVGSSVRPWQLNLVLLDLFSGTTSQSEPTYLWVKNCKGLNYLLACLGPCYLSLLNGILETWDEPSTTLCQSLGWTRIQTSRWLSRIPNSILQFTELVSVVGSATAIPMEKVLFLFPGEQINWSI